MWLTRIQEFLSGIAHPEEHKTDEQTSDEDAAASESADGIRSGESTPTAGNLLKQAGAQWQAQQDRRIIMPAINAGTVVDASVEVIITPHRDSGTQPTSKPNSARQTSDGVLQVQMIISAWSFEDIPYFTLTFTGVSSEPASSDKAKPSKRTVTRTTTPIIRPLGSASSSSSGGRRSYTGTGSTGHSSMSSPMMRTPSFPPSGPPSAVTSSSRSLFQKASRLKDAILNSVNLPAYAMWKDESFGIPNKALLALHPDNTPGVGGTQREWLAQYTLYTEDFDQEIGVDEFPIVELCRSQRRIEGRRVGLRNPKTKAKLVFEIMGEPIIDEITGEFLGGIVIFKDVTEYTKRIAQQIKENERQFEYIANLIPIMVWRTTPEGEHDWYSQRWYDYTGLSVADSFGEGWKLAFHEDDMAATGARWAHSLATGDEYNTEYRCRRADGQWRWMLGRAVPFLDDNGEIVKWFGTCTDIHELVEARREAKDIREQLQRVLEHAKVTLWAINKDWRITLFEGNHLQPSKELMFEGGSNLIGRNIHDLIGAAEEWHAPIKQMLAGDSEEDFIESVCVFLSEPLRRSSSSESRTWERVQDAFSSVCSAD